MGYNTDSYLKKKSQTKKQEERKRKISGSASRSQRTDKSEGLNRLK